MQRLLFDDFGLYRRTTPFDQNWGGGRGQIVDRYYIEKFLEENADDVRGRVLDFFDDTYARRFGGDKVEKLDVLHLTADNPHATIIADLSDGNQIPPTPLIASFAPRFSCLFLTFAPRSEPCTGFSSQVV